jgi:type VI secretion system protein
MPGDVDHLMDSVRRSLQMMLNSRHDGAETIPDFGTSGFQDLLRGHQSMSRFEEEITLSIEKYEPRLTDVDVSFVVDESDPFKLHFNIVANIVSEDGDTPTVFRSIVGSGGEVLVSSY